VRITEETHAVVRELAEASGRSMQEVLAEAVGALRRSTLLEKTNDAYARLRDDPRRWAEEIAERTAWEATLADGIEE
jgi:hypothetical protein